MQKNPGSEKIIEDLVGNPLAVEVDRLVASGVDAGRAVVVLDQNPDKNLVALVQPLQHEDGGGGQHVVIFAA